MNIFVIIVLLILGFVLIIKGGDFFVDAAVWIAEKTGIPKVIIGATIVSLATTLPELLVSLFAALAGNVDIAIGNSIGSATVNISFIMGISLIFMPAVIKRKDYMLKSLLMIASICVILGFGLTGQVGLIPSVFLLVLFVITMTDSLLEAKASLRAEQNQDIHMIQNPDGAQAADLKNMAVISDSTIVNAGGESIIDVSSAGHKDKTNNEVFVNIIKFLFGAVFIVLGSRLLVDNGSTLARMIGVSERIIGVTIIAIGTSLPELVTTLSSIAKKQSSLSIGNIIGANIINLTLVTPLCALVSGRALPVSQQFAYLDIPVCLAVCLIAVAPGLIRQRFSKIQGILLVCVYIVYLIFTTMV